MTSSCVANIVSCSLIVGFVAACAENEIDDPDEQALLDAKADGYSDLAGPWQNYSSFIGLRELSLASDKTYTATYWRVCNVAGCEFESGTFKLTKSTSGSTKYIRLTHDGALVARYAYRLQSGQLKLTDTDDDTKITLTRPVCFGVSLAGCTEDPLCEFVPGQPCDPVPNGPPCTPNLGPHCEARPCVELDFATCAENPSCAQVQGQPCDPTPDGPECPPNLGPRCESR